MAHPQHNFTSNFNGSEGHNAELTLNINGTEHKYTPAGNDKEFTVTGAVRINVNLDGSELVERITTVLDGDSLPLLVEQSLDGTENNYTYVGLQDNEWLFGRVTTTHIDSVGINTTDGSVRRETLPLASDVAIVSNTDPAVYTKLRTAAALGHLPVLDYQGTYATYVTIDNNILKFATEAADPNVESYVYTVASDNTVTATPRNAGVVRADSVDTEPGTFIDKLEVVDNVRDPDDPDDPALLTLGVTVDAQGKRKVAINEDNLRNFVGYVTDDINDIWDTLDHMDFDAVPHGSFGSSLNQSPGDGTTTSIQVSIFRPIETTVGDAIEWAKTTEIGGTDFGTVTLEPGTYIICSDITCQWVGVPRGTYLPQVGNVLGEPFDFSQQRELHRRMTNVVTVSDTTQFKMRINFDAATPVMGFWINSAQIVKIAGGMSQTNITHDSTLVGDGNVAQPLGVNTQNVAQATLAVSVAPAFDPAKPNDEGGYAYYAGKDIVSYQGKVYLFIVNKASGVWDSQYVEEYKDISSKFLNEKNRSITQDYYENIFEGGEVLTPLGTLSLAGVKFVDTYTPNRCYAGSSQTFYIRSYFVEKGKHYRIKNCRGTGAGTNAFAVVTNKQLTDVGTSYYAPMYQNVTDGASHSSNVTLQALDFTAEFDGILAVTGSTTQPEVSVVESLSVKNKATLLDTKIDAEVGNLNGKLDAEISRSIGQDYTDDYKEGSVISASNTLSSAALKFVSSYTPSRCYANTSTTFYIRSYFVEKGKHYRIKNCRGTGTETGPFATITNEAVTSTDASNYKAMSQNVTDGLSHDNYVTLLELDFVASENGYLNVSGSVNYDGVSLYNLDPISVKEKVETLSVKNNQWQGKKIVWLGTSVPFGVNATTSYAKVASERLGFNLVPAVIPGQAIHCAVDSESGLPYPIASGSTCLSKNEYDAARVAGLTNITIEDTPITPWVPGGSYNDYYRAWDNVITQDNADADLWVFDVVPNNINFALDDWSNFNRASWKYFDGQPFSSHRSTFLGAVIYLMDKIYTLNPYARFVFVLGSTYEYSNGKSNFEKLESLGCAVIDVWKKINRMGPSLQVIKSLNGTNDHPSTFAHQVLGNMLANELLLIN